MRQYDRVRCLATLEVEGGEFVIAVRCQKDCRHGHGKKRQGFLYHRVDIDGAKITWPGIGVMDEEMEMKRAEKALRPPRKEGNLTWEGP